MDGWTEWRSEECLSGSRHRHRNARGDTHGFAVLFMFWFTSAGGVRLARVLAVSLS